MMEPIYRPGKTHNVSYPAGSLLVGPQTITATITQEGVTDASTAINVPEIHDIELAQANLKPNTIYELTVDVSSDTVPSYVITSTALDSTPTIAELVTALQADADYAAAPFTIAANGTSGITITWKTDGAQTATSTMTLYQSGATLSDNVRVVRVIATTDCHMKIHSPAILSADMLIKANLAEYFVVPQACKLFFTGSTGVAYVTEMWR